MLVTMGCRVMTPFATQQRCPNSRFGSFASGAESFSTPSQRTGSRVKVDDCTDIQPARDAAAAVDSASAALAEVSGEHAKEPSKSAASGVGTAVDSSTCVTLEIGGLLRSGAVSQMTGASQMSDGLRSQETSDLKNRGGSRVRVLRSGVGLLLQFTMYGKFSVG